MKGFKKIFYIFIATLMLFTLSVTAFAGNETNDGNIKIQVATDKGSYGATGVAEITATITNVSGEDINNVTAQAVFDDLAPAGKRKSETSKSVDVLKAGESFSFTYKATLNKDEHKLNIFQKIILWFVRLFNGGYNADNDNINVVTECVTEIEFGKFIAENVVQVGYEEREAESNDYTYEELIENVDIDKLYENDDNDITVKDGVEFINNIIVITFEDYCKDERKAEIINSVNGKVVGGDTFYNDLYIEVEKSSFEELENICYKISNKDGVYSADFVIFNTIIDYLPNDPYSEDKGVQLDWNITYENINTTYNHWWILLSEIHRAWDYDSYFENINIGVVDEGFLTSHKDLDISVVSEENVPNNHGTHVAGIIGAKHNNGEGLAGVVNNCSLYGYSLSHITDEEVYKALRILVAEHNCKVINLSIGKKVYEKDNKVYLDKAFKTGLSDYRVNNWGKKASKKMADLLEKGYDFVVVQSAGNGAYNTNRGIDADNNGYFCSIKKENCYSNKTVSVDDIMNRILVVANADKDSTGCNLDRASNGNISYVDIAAPGIWNFSTVAGIEQNDGDFKITAGQEYAKIGGTSMAAPVVAGVTGLVWSVNENFTGAEVREIVIETAKKGGIWVEDNPYSLTTGDFPLVNAKLAVEEAISRTYGEMATITGTVYNETMTEVIPDVKIEVIDNSSDSFDPIATATTGLNGKYTLKLPYGDYSISFTHSDYEYYGMSLTVNNESYIRDIALLGLESSVDGVGTVSFVVKDNESNEILEEISAWFRSKISFIKNFNNGIVTVGLPVGEYICILSKEGYKNKTFNFTIQKDVDTVITNPVYMVKEDVEDTKTIKDSGECGADGSNVTWTLYEDGELVISGEGDMKHSPNWKNHNNEIKSVVINDGVTSIGAYSFGNCKALQKVDMSNSVISIFAEAFYCCENLTEVKISDDLIYIWASAFENTAIKEIIIPSSVKLIAEYAFARCNNLSRVTINNGIEEIYKYAFADCSKLEGITIPGSVKTIRQSAFSGCTLLKNINIEHGVETIEGYVFAGTAIEKLSLPNTIKTLYSETRSSSWPSGVYADTSCFDSAKYLKEVIFEYGIKTIPPYSFYSLHNINVVIPNSVLNIGKYSFAFSDISEVNLPNSVAVIEECAFYKSNIKQINLPNSTTTIKKNAFDGCLNIKSITIPQNVSDLNQYAFLNCENLIEIIVHEDNATYSSYDGILYNKDKTNLILCPGSKEQVEIYSGTLVIESTGFQNCDKLLEITIPNGVCEIENYAFNLCSSLIHIVIPDSLKSIGYGAFMNCNSLDDIFFMGTQEGWEAITIKGSNDNLINATIHYNS